jgi:cytochrome c oxidase subunit 4
MPTATLRPRSYFILCIALILGVVLNVAMSFMNVQPVWHTVISLSIAFPMVISIALFGMHLVFADKVIWSVFLVACFWVGILLVLTYTDYFTREMTPFAPGH